MTERAIPVEVSEYLNLHHIITLSTASFTGMPHANTVAYASDDNHLYFAAPESTQLVRNIMDRQLRLVHDRRLHHRRAQGPRAAGCRPVRSGGA
jgi:general stress protein 26